MHGPEPIANPWSKIDKSLPYNILLYIISDMPKNSKFALLLSIGLIGTAAITSQVLLIREIVNLFAGNELLYGLTIFLWLIFYAIGSGVPDLP